MLDIEAQVAYWRGGAEEDWAVALELLQHRRERHALFLAHLALEKVLKAHVCRETRDLAPRIYNLVRLAQLSGTAIPHSSLDILAEMNAFSMEGRYPKVSLGFGVGCFYTPGPVVAFMVRQALGAYLRAELPEEEAEALERLLDCGDPSGLRSPGAARDALARVTVCDPACGDGAFLVGALGQLGALRVALSDLEEPSLSRHHLVAGIVAGQPLREWSWTRPPWSPPDRGCWPHWRDEPKAGRTRAYPGWRTGSPRGIVSWPGFSSDRQAGGSPHLADEAGDWPSGFRGPLSRGGFDVLLMNPPYLAANRVPGAQRDGFAGYCASLKARHGFSGDLYVHFFHQGLALLRPGGILAAITPGSFLTNSTREPLRRELLRHRLKLIALMPAGLFPALVYPVVTLLQKGEPEPGHRLRFADLRGGDRRPVAAVLQQDYRDGYGAHFYQPTPENRRLYHQLLPATATVGLGDRRFAPLGVVAPALDTGIDSGNVRERIFLRQPEPGRALHRLLQGTQVVRYGCWWEHPSARFRYVDIGYRPDPARKGTGRGGRESGKGEYWRFRGPVANHHVPERLLMRQTADQPFVGYLRQGEERVYTDNTLHTLLLTDRGRELGISYGYLLALLNSATLRRIYRAVAQEEGRVLAQVKTGIVNLLPILVPEPAEREALEGWVAAIQGLYGESGFPVSPAAEEQIRRLQRKIDRLVAEMYRPLSE